MSTKTVAKTIVDHSTGELRTLDIPENEVTEYLRSVGINPATVSWELPPAIFLNAIEGAMLALRFHDVAMAEVSEFGPSPVISFEALAGYAVMSKSGGVDVVPGEVYSMHLFSQTLHDRFIELAPEFGELVVVRYCGTRASGRRQDKDGNPTDYHAFVVVCPNRPIVSTTLGWDSLSLKGGKK